MTRGRRHLAKKPKKSASPERIPHPLTARFLKEGGQEEEAKETKGKKRKKDRKRERKKERKKERKQKRKKERKKEERIPAHGFPSCELFHVGEKRNFEVGEVLKMSSEFVQVYRHQAYMCIHTHFTPTRA